MDYGFDAVVASSFGDIFRNNSSKQGLVTVQLSTNDVDELSAIVKEEPARLVVVDVEKLVVEVPEAGWRRTFVLDAMTQERLLEGWDDIGISLRRVDAISKYEATSQAPSLRHVFDAEGHAQNA
jgi:3-isopropylmalate/(R)-2-methylmalate dehydratase small subunit